MDERAIIDDLKKYAERLKNKSKKRKADDVNKDKDTETLQPVQRAPKKTDALSRSLKIVRALQDDEPFEEDKYHATEVYDRRPMKTDWNDLEYIGRPGYTMVYLADEALVDIGRIVFEGIMTTITRSTLIGLLLLTYNLKDAVGRNIFGRIPTVLLTMEDLYLDEETDDLIANVALVNNFSEKIDPNKSKEAMALMAKAYCFLAGSYLRLFTKSVDNYMNIKEHLADGFKGFYGYLIPFNNYRPSEKAVEAIKGQFDTSLLMKHTLYRILYAGKDEAAGTEIKDFLYGIHLEVTGLHCFNLFMKCMSVLKVNNNKLLNLLSTDAFEEELILLQTMFDNFFSNRTTTRLGMWRYARIFDNSFYSRLQTKNCTMFTAVLAHLYHIVIPPKEHRSALNIARLREMAPEDLNTAKVVAHRLHSYYENLGFTGKYKAAVQIYKEELAKDAEREKKKERDEEEE